MYYAITVKDNAITGVHESIVPITETTFAKSPFTSDHTVIPLTDPAEYQSGQDIRSYTDGVLRPLIDRINDGLSDIPNGYELIDGELIKTQVLEADAPPTLMAKVLAAETSATEANTAFTNQLAAMKPLLTEAVKDKPADIVISASVFILDWVQEKYTLGDVRMWQGQPKRCCQSHDSTNNPDWLPNVASLWAPFHATKEENALPYVPPTGAHDIYKVGEYMAFTDGKYYLNVEDTNFSPTEYPAAWHVKSDSGAYVAIAIDEPEPEELDPAIEYNSNGTVVWAEWLTWDGLNNHLYQVGDRVTYNGTRYTSTTGNNHWQPGVYGWSVA